MNEVKEDEQVRLVQEWLNVTYGDKFAEIGYEVDITGKTGWNTVNGLIMGLQIELGIVNIAPTFGDATIEAMDAYGVIAEGINDSNNNINKIINGGGWCKGYSSYWSITDVPGFDEHMTAEIKSLEINIGITQTGIVDTKLMKALLSMDAYEIPFNSSGKKNIREYQQWLNKMYKDKTAYYYIPCDGLASASTQKGTVFGIQYECGMDDVANGHFGDETKAQLRAQGQLYLDDKDGEQHFVHLFKGIFFCNDETKSEFDGRFDVALSESVLNFQEFTAIQINGNGSYETWCELLVSCGDTNRTTKALDCSIEKLTSERTQILSSTYSTAGRYLINVPGGTLDKKLEHYEIANLMVEDMSLFLIYQRDNSSLTSFDYEQGVVDGRGALLRAIGTFNFSNTTIYFPVDFDAYDFEVYSNVLPYFLGVAEVFADGGYNTNNLRVGVYGARNTCKIVSEMVPTVERSFISGMSTGYSGNLGFPLTNNQNWVYNQIVEDYNLGIDKDVMRYEVGEGLEDSIANLSLEHMKWKWSLVGKRYYASSLGNHAFLDPAYRGYECPEGKQSIAFSETLDTYSLSVVELQKVDENDQVVVEIWYMVDANTNYFFVPAKDVDSDGLDFPLEYMLQTVVVNTMGGVGRLDPSSDNSNNVVSGAGLSATNGFASPALIVEESEDGYINQVLSWVVDDNLTYRLRPFKKTSYQKGYEFYAFSDQNDCMIIKTHQF